MKTTTIFSLALFLLIAIPLSFGVTCTVGQKAYCENQKGVCEGSRVLCLSGTTPICTIAEFGSSYEDLSAAKDGSLPETKCDDLDNDCDGFVDEGCQNTNLLFFEGSYYGCNLTAPYVETTTVPTNTWYALSLRFEFMYPQVGIQASDTDVENIETACTNLGSWYCDAASDPAIWADAFVYSPTKPIDTLKELDLAWPFTYYDSALYIPPPSISQVNLCCPNSFCFNGTSCEDSETYFNNPKKPPIYSTYGQTGFRCNSQGEWRVVSLKKDFFHEDDGYCTESNECYAEGQCFRNGEWKIFNGVDRMCIDGNWTTRVKYIAAALTNYTQDYKTFVGPDYSLYCDDVQKSLGDDSSALNYPITDLIPDSQKASFNEYTGLLGATDTGSSYCRDQNGNDIPCVNSFCVLSFGNTVILGTSLNRPINTSSFPFYEAFGFRDEDSQTEALIEKLDTGDNITRVFQSPESGKLFYSKNKQIVFYTVDSSLPDFKADLGSKMLSILTSPIQSIINVVKNFIKGPQEFSVVLDRTADFDKLYFNTKGSRSIAGVQETKFNDVEDIEIVQTALTINYTGFTSDICRAAIAQGLGCNITATGDSLVYGVTDDITAGFDEIWPDLTAKVRID
jgi:hypothetical protein